MKSAITSQFTYQDYCHLKGINDFLIAELCFPDNEEPSEENFEQFKEKHFMKLVKIHTTFTNNNKRTIYVSVTFGFCYFVIIDIDGKYIMDNSEIYKLVSNYFKRIDNMPLTQKLKHFIFKEGTHTIESITSLAFRTALKNKSFDIVKKILIDKYNKEIAENVALIHEEKIAEFYINNKKTVLIRYCSNAQVYLKIIEHFFDEFITLFESCFEQERSIDENMELIVFSRSFCGNMDVKIY